MLNTFTATLKTTGETILSHTGFYSDFVSQLRTLAPAGEVTVTSRGRVVGRYFDGRYETTV